MSNPKDATGTADPRRFKQGASDANYKRVLDRFGERGVFHLIACRALECSTRTTSIP